MTISPQVDPFHLSFTVLVHYRLLNILDFEDGSPIMFQTEHRIPFYFNII
jgi:hypothetical protein